MPNAREEIMPRTFRVELHRCEETHVFVATSPDIPGLVVEAETVGGVTDAIKECAPHLIEDNLGLESDDGYAINVGHVSAARPAVLRSMSVEIPLVAWAR